MPPPAMYLIRLQPRTSAVTHAANALQGKQDIASDLKEQRYILWFFLTRRSGERILTGRKNEVMNAENIRHSSRLNIPRIISRVFSSTLVGRTSRGRRVP